MSKSQKYFEPDTLARIRPLGLRARTLIEGLVAGLHRSPLRGHSIEFAQHREYTPGDDLRQLDWKVYARSDRYYLKQYEDETNLICYFLLDQSESMVYQGSQSALSKLEYGQLIACSLAYLIVTQQDSAGLVTFSTAIDDWIPPSSSPSQLEDMIRVMERGKRTPKTQLAEVLKECNSRIPKPSLIVLISDLFDTAQQTLQALKLLRYAGHDAMLLHVLDQDEVQFPFDQMSQFEGLEDTSSVMTDSLLIAGAYRRAMAEFQKELELGCQQLDVDFFSLRTDESLAAALPRILAKRLARSN